MSKTMEARNFRAKAKTSNRKTTFFVALVFGLTGFVFAEGGRDFPHNKA
jgi:hypothetical protein